jgi:DNA-binding PucR family transcriptional regulator
VTHSSNGHQRPVRIDAQNEHITCLSDVAASASRDVGAPVELLGNYLTLLADAATSGREPHQMKLEAVGLLGRRAAELGIPAGTAVQLYLAAARRLWPQLPTVIRARDNKTVRTAAAAVLRVVDQAVASLVDGHATGRRQMVRWEETLRREFINDLLRGDADVGRLVERAEPFGLDMARAHQVALAAPTGHLAETTPALSTLEHTLVHQLGDRDVLVAAKDGWIVIIAPADTDLPALRTGPHTLGDLVLAELERTIRGRPWRVAVGRPYPGPYGIARSYEEAREGLAMAVRLHLDTPVIHAEQLLIYRVLTRDQPAITDLVHSVLGNLTQSRGGAPPLLATLDAYFATGNVTTETARRLHLSVRTITYRLDRIKTLTGHDPTDPTQRFTIHTAVLGAKLLGWPEHHPDNRGTPSEHTRTGSGSG